MLESRGFTCSFTAVDVNVLQKLYCLEGNQGQSTIINTFRRWFRLPSFAKHLSLRLGRIFSVKQFESCPVSFLTARMGVPHNAGCWRAIRWYGDAGLSSRWRDGATLLRKLFER